MGTHTLTTQPLSSVSAALWPFGKFGETEGPLGCQGQSHRYSGWSSSKGKSVIGLELWLEGALVRLTGEVNGTLNLFGLLVKFFGNHFLEAFGKGQFALCLFCTLASYWDKNENLGFGAAIWSESPCRLVSFPTL